MAEWNSQSESEFVEMWRQHPQLYDSPHMSYLRRGKKHACLSKFAETFGTTGFEECKWSNEGCKDDKECCSESCAQPHPGTNCRCAMSPLHGPCLFDYQCVSRYVCGSEDTCCSAAWGTCTEKRDCCNPNYKCIDVPGFVYKRCLRKALSSGVVNRSRRHHVDANFVKHSLVV